MATNDPTVAALLRERAGYVQRGLGDRVKAVDEQLAARGHQVDAEQEPVTGTRTQEPEKGQPKGRRAPARRTTTGGDRADAQQ